MDGIIHIFNIVDYKGQNMNQFSICNLDDFDEEGNAKIAGEETKIGLRPELFINSNNITNGTIFF